MTFLVKGILGNGNDVCSNTITPRHYVDQILIDRE